MLVCKACNTRFGKNMAACPNCGRRAAESAVEEGTSGLSPSDSSPLPLSAPVADEGDADAEVELEEQVVVEPPKPSAKPAANRAPSSARPAREPGPTVFHLSPGQVRTLIAEQPGLLEKGLGIYADESGTQVGAGFPSPVGEIDLLARDPKGNFVVVMVPESNESGNVVGGILQRMGWVRKHVASDKKEVRGVVVLEQLPEEVAYAAAGTGGTVTFKTFRVALTFHDIDI